MEENKSTYYRFQDSNFLRMSPLSKFRELNENTFLYNPLNINLPKENISNNAFSDDHNHDIEGIKICKSRIAYCKNENSIISKENESTSKNTHSVELKEEDSYYNLKSDEALPLTTSFKNLLRKPLEREKSTVKSYKLNNSNTKSKNNPNISIKQFWSKKEDYYLLRLLFTSPYGLNSVLNYLPKTRTCQSYKSRIVSFNKKFSKPLVSDGNQDTNNQLSRECNINKNKSKCESAFINLLRDVSSHFNLRSIQDFIAFKSNEVALPPKFLIDQEDLNEINSTNLNKQVYNNNLYQTSIDNVFISLDTPNHYFKCNNNELNINKNNNREDSCLSRKVIPDLNSSIDQDQLINSFLILIFKKKEKLKFDPELLQTQLFKSYQ